MYFAFPEAVSRCSHISISRIVNGLLTLNQPLRTQVTNESVYIGVDHPEENQPMRWAFDFFMFFASTSYRIILWNLR